MSAIRELRRAIQMLLVMTLITGIAYPAVVTAFAQFAFPDRANGSLIVDNGRPVGSSLIGQPFSAPQYFWSRPSATTPYPYNSAASSGSNAGPTNPALIEAVKNRLAALAATAGVPVDMVTTSASGLDPHISPAAARLQIARVAHERGLTAAAVRTLVERHTAARQFGVLGEARVNVLELNLDLDRLGRPH